MRRSQYSSYLFVLLWTFSPSFVLPWRVFNTKAKDGKHHANMHFQHAEFFRKGLLTCAKNIGLGLSLILPSFPAVSKDFPLFNEVWSLTEKNYYDSTFNNLDWNEVRADIQNKLEQGTDEKKAIQYMLKKLDDKYTKLYDKTAFQNLFKYDAAGVGVIFESDSTTNQVVVSSPPIPGSSAEKAGIQKGDIIYSINNIPTTKINALGILELLSTDDSNEIKLEYSSSTNPEEKKVVSLLRSKEKVANPVKYKLQTVQQSTDSSDIKKVGYVKLQEFNSQAVPGMKQALEEFNKEKADVVVLDLRGNTGGGFQFALNIGGMFMNGKEVVTAAGRGADKMTFKTSYPAGVLTDLPLVVVTDGLSASATEALVAGLKDNCRAVIVGSRTFGKGKIQGVFGLDDGEGLTLTVAQYISPKGTVIQSKGLEPDLPLQVLNPYINYLLGNSEFDVSRINYAQVTELLSSCRANNLIAVNDAK